MNIRMINESDATELAEYYGRNRSFLKPWEPLRDDNYFTMSAWQERLDLWCKEHQNGVAARFASYTDDGAIVGVCNLTSIVKGPFQACFMGYSVDQSYEGQGVMSKLAKFTTDYVFDELQLNRVMANYMPHNKRSEKLLLKLGFEREGLARKYLKINGKWEDHVLTSKVRGCS